MPSVIDRLPKEARGRLHKKPQPSWCSPMLATLARQPFSNNGWVYERKFDGERCLAFKTATEARLLSRNRKTLNNTYPELVEEIRRQGSGNFIADGEIVAFEGSATSFARLQRRMQIQDPEEARKSGVAVYYYLFDLLYVDGYDVATLSLLDRKLLLKNLLSFDDKLRYSQHKTGHGEAYFKEACQKAWEGLIAKEASSPYIHARSSHWLKFKCSKQQEFVVGGYTNPQGSRIGFGALLIGYYNGRDLKYAGKVGTGYDEKTLHSLAAALSSSGRKKPPFKGDETLPRSNVHWTEPRMVIEVAFTEWTGDGKLRHPRFLGVRRDKTARQVHREDA